MSHNAGGEGIEPGVTLCYRGGGQGLSMRVIVVYTISAFVNIHPAKGLNGESDLREFNNEVLRPLPFRQLIDSSQRSRRAI